MATRNIALVKFQFILSEALILLKDSNSSSFTSILLPFGVFQSTTDGFSNTKQKHSTMCAMTKKLIKQVSILNERNLNYPSLQSYISLLVVDGNQNQET